MAHALSPLRRTAPALVAAALLASGCGGAAHTGAVKAPAPIAPAPVAPAATDLCATLPAASPRDTITVGLTEAVDPAHIAQPTNDAERLVFRQLLEGGASASCDGSSRGAGRYRLFHRDGALLALPDGSGLPILVMRVVPGADPRDLLDGGVDLLVTRDAVALAYADRRADLLTAPLAWDRTYVLVAPGLSRVGDLRGAVSAESRPAEPPFWWADSVSCARGRDALPRSGYRIGFPDGDQIARELAERVAAGSPKLAIAAIAPDILDAALTSGAYAGYVLPLPRTMPAACGIVPRIPANWSIDPLIDSRPRAVLRRGALRVSADADGSLRIVPPAAP